MRTYERRLTLTFEKNKFEVRIHILTKYINEEVLQDVDDGLSVKLSERTVIRWMKIFQTQLPRNHQKSVHGRA